MQTVTFFEDVNQDPNTYTYDYLLSLAGEIGERKKADNFALGDILIAACGPAVIGRPSPERSAVMYDFGKRTGSRLRTMQEYRQMAEFYTPAMRVYTLVDANSYTMLREAMREACRENEGEAIEELRMVALALLAGWNDDDLGPDELGGDGGDKPKPIDTTLAALLEEWGDIPVKRRQRKDGIYVIETVMG